MGGWILNELSGAQRGLTAEDRIVLERAGVPDLMISCGMVGAVAIELDAGGLHYQPSDDGRRAFVTPCRVADPWTPEAVGFEIVPQYGDLVDLVAWHPARPLRWATRRGLAAWLGACEPQFLGPAPVTVKRSPLSWLQGGAIGLCVLDRKPADVYRVLSLCRRIEAEDSAHQFELTRILHHPFSIPPVSSARAAGRAA